MVVERWQQKQHKMRKIVIMIGGMFVVALGLGEMVMRVVMKFVFEEMWVDYLVHQIEM